MTQHIESIVKVEQLHAGYVLNETITQHPGLTQGRVLTPDDIEKLKNTPGLTEISVFAIDKTSQLERRIAQTQAKDTSASSSETKSQVNRLSDQVRSSALFDAQFNAQLKEHLEKRKTSLRGFNYEEELEKYRQRHMEKFSQELKYVQAQTRQASLQAIEHIARTKVDFDRIRQLEGLGKEELFQVFDRYALYIDLFTRAALTEKKIYTTYVENIVMDIIEDVGYKLARGLLALALQDDDKHKFMVSHTLQVLIISVITAIELTNIINEKALVLSGEDINTFLAISKKTFTIDELIDLGVCAVLHDIDIIKSFPDLSRDHKFNLREEAKIDLHPSNGFHIAKLMNLEFDIQRAIFQHHERFDGSGFPNGAPPRMFTKFTPVLMFAEYYVEKSTRNPFIDESLVPRKVIVELLTHHRDKFDGDVIYAYLRAASLFPIGSWVKLSNGNIAIVSEVNHRKLDAPIVVQLFDEHMAPLNCEELNLADSEVTIVHPISLQTIKQLHQGDLHCLLSSDKSK